MDTTEVDDQASDLSQQDDDDSSEAGPQKSSRWKETREVFSELSSIFPENFVAKDTSVPYYDRLQRDSSSVPLLKIQPTLTDTWLDPYKKDSPSDSVGYWPSSVKLPPKASQACPPKMLTRPDRRHSDISVVDDDLRAMLEAPKFGALHLDPSVFQAAKVDVSKENLGTIDYLLRSSLYDSFVTDELLALVLRLVPLVQSDLGISSTAAAATASSPHLDLLSRVVRVAAHSHSRSVNSLTASFVSSKVAIRDSVLGKFQVPTLTNTLLRGSSFKDEGLFGPLPESFQETLKASQGKDLMCKNKHGSSSSKPYASTKRSAPRTTFSAKRPRPYVPSSSTGATTFSFSAPQTSYAPRQGFRPRRGHQKRTGSSS